MGHVSLRGTSHTNSLLCYLSKMTVELATDREASAKGRHPLWLLLEGYLSTVAWCLEGDRAIRPDQHLSNRIHAASPWLCVSTAVS